MLLSIFAHRYIPLNIARVCSSIVCTAGAVATSHAASPETVVITGQRSESDLRTDSVDSVGPLGATTLLDTPYSVTVLPSQVIRNSQAVSFKEVSKYLPLVAYQEQQGPDVLRPQTRGMQSGNFQNTKIDGLTVFITVPSAMEQFEQIEVVNGVPAALYGPANPAGMFNFVSKRSTDEPLREMGLTYTSDSIATGRLDFGGRIGNAGVVGYRLNVVYGNGDGYVTGSHQRRLLGDLGIDIRAWTGGVVELNYSDYSLETFGYPGWFTYGQGINLPAAPDAKRQGYGQSYAGVDLHNRVGTVRLKQELGSNWNLVAGVLHQDGLRDMSTPVNNLTTNTGNYTASLANGFAPRFVITSNMAYLDGAVITGALAARPDLRHGWISGRHLRDPHTGHRRERAARNRQHPVACRVCPAHSRPTRHACEFRVVQQRPAGRERQRHDPRRRAMVHAPRCESGLVPHRQHERSRRAHHAILGEGTERSREPHLQTCG